MYGPYGPQKGVSMILSLCVSIKEIFEQGRDLPWHRPKTCPQSRGDRIWGHGFVGALFDGFVQQVLLRRWRCPDCRCVLRVRLGGYFDRFQAPIESNRTSIAYRLKTGRWPPARSRSRQGHWLKSLLLQIEAHLKTEQVSGPIEGFYSLIDKGIIPVCRSI